MKTVKGKKVAVTGSCGFIGPNLIEELLAQGASVIALDLPNTDWGKLPKKVKQVKVDIMDTKTLSGVFKNVDIVYHLAARTDIDSNKLEDYAVNYEGTKNVFVAATSQNKLERFVFYSTQLVVGLFNETRFIDESEPFKTKTAYGQSKIEGEKVVRAYSKKTGVPFTTIRPTSVYGPHGEAPYKAFFRAVKKRHYFHVGKANNLVSWVYVKNLVNLTILVSISKQAKNETYFGNDLYPYTMREIVDCISAYYDLKTPTVPNFIITPLAYALGVFKLAGLNVPIYPFRLKNIKMNYCYDVSKSLEIGYKPEYGLSEGIKETLDWYEARKAI